MARKSKYTPETVQKITQAIELGATYELACNFGSISYQTFLNWLEAKVEFFEAVKLAEGKAAVKWLAKIEQAASDGNWQAAAWKLERRYPTLYGRQVQDVNHNFDLTKLSDEELRRIVEKGKL